MTIGQAFDYCNYISAKNFAGRTLTPAEFNDQYPSAEDDFCRSIMRSQPDQLSNWRTLKGAVDDMKLQTIKRDFTLTFTSAKAELPNIVNSSTEFMDWLSFALLITATDDCNVQYDSEIPVEVVMEDEWATRLNSSVDFPTLEFPIVKFIFDIEKKVQVAPTTITTMRLSYYKIPRRVVFAFTTDANNNIIYDAANSVQSELPPITHVDVCNILLTKIGVNLQDPNIQQYAQQAKQLV